MGKRKERRVTARFYEDDPNDQFLLNKVDKLMREREVRSITELIRKGIDLVYEDCYHFLQKADTDLLKHEMDYVAGKVGEEVVSKLDERIRIHDATIMGAITLLAQGMGASASQAENEKISEQFNKEPGFSNQASTDELPQQTMSFLAGLNED